MKKTLLYLLLCLSFVFYSGLSFGQCTPDPGVTDPEGNGEMVPDTLEVAENTPFSQVLTIIAPDTASVGSMGHINLHHITLKSLQNKPAWLSYICNPSSCEFVGTASRCVLTTGTPPVGSAGFYPVDVIVDVYAIILGQSVLVQSDYNSGMPFVIWVHPEGWGIEDNVYKGFGLHEPQPNPFNNKTQIGCYTETPQWITFKVMDMLGGVVYNERTFTNAGTNYFNVDGARLSSGIYFYSVTDAQNRVITKKMIKN